MQSSTKMQVASLDSPRTSKSIAGYVLSSRSFLQPGQTSEDENVRMKSNSEPIVQHKAISSVSLGVLKENKDFGTPLMLGIKVFGVITFFNCETSTLKFTKYFSIS